jgi:hypothetical protein
LKENIADPVYKAEIVGRGDPSCSPRDTSISAKVGTKIRRPAAVMFACGLKAMEFLTTKLQHSAITSHFTVEGNFFPEKIYVYDSELDDNDIVPVLHTA